MKNRRVVITGIGVISSVGVGKTDFWNQIVEGQSGITEVERIDTSELPCHKGGEVKILDISKYLEKGQIDKMGKASQFGVIAAKLAAEDAQVQLESLELERVGVSLGTTYGEAQILEDIDDHLYLNNKKEDLAQLCEKFPYYQINANIAKVLKLKGENIMIPNACAAGNFAIGYAYDLISNNNMDCMFAGGVDVFSRVAYLGFNRLKAMAPEKVQPFDKDRKGMMVGEGAGIVFLESLDSALARGAEIYAEVLGYGVSNDAFDMVTPHPDGEGVLIAMKKAIKDANISLDDVDFISLHGTGTKANDKAEFQIMSQLFGEKNDDILVNSIKSMLGHTMGAASAIEAITCALIIKTGVIPPTINYENPDPNCNFNCVPNIARKHPVTVALNNSYAFGGNNTCLVLKKYHN